MLSVFRGVIAATVATAVCVGAGVLIEGPSDSAGGRAAIPLSELDTTTLTVRRAAFCDSVPADAVQAALGSLPSGTSSYGPGDTAQVTDTVHDVAGEYGCSWRGDGGAAARAWVFAPAVTRTWAATLVATLPKGCSMIVAPAFGAPTSTLSCGDTVTFRGLFGDAWLSCQLTGSIGETPTTLLDRASHWCAAVAMAAG